MIFRQYRNTNYWVSRCGRTYNMKRGVMLKSWINKVTGYCVTKITYNGKKHDFTIHRLVAETFIPNPENKAQVNHKDGNKSNNIIENLEWTTPSENQIHAYRAGLNGGIKRKRDNSVKLNPELVLEVLKYKKEGLSLVKIAKKFNVSRHCISDVVKGRKWKSVTNGLL